MKVIYLNFFQIPYKPEFFFGFFCFYAIELCYFKLYFTRNRFSAFMQLITLFLALKRKKVSHPFEANHAYSHYINQNNAFSLFSLNYAVVSVNARKRFLFLVWLWIKQFLALSHQMVWASSHGTQRYCFFVAKLSSVQYYRAQNVFPLVCCCYAEFSFLAVNFFLPVCR